KRLLRVQLRGAIQISPGFPELTRRKQRRTHQCARPRVSAVHRCDFARFVVGLLKPVHLQQGVTESQPRVSIALIRSQNRSISRLSLGVEPLAVVARRLLQKLGSRLRKTDLRSRNER